MLGGSTIFNARKPCRWQWMESDSQLRKPTVMIITYLKFSIRFSVPEENIQFLDDTVRFGSLVNDIALIKVRIYNFTLSIKLSINICREK